MKQDWSGLTKQNTYVADAASVGELAQKYFGPETVPIKVSFGALRHGGKDNATVMLARYLVAS
jgi:hypothetical protein